MITYRQHFCDLCQHNVSFLRNVLSIRVSFTDTQITNKTQWSPIDSTFVIYLSTTSRFLEMCCRYVSSFHDTHFANKPSDHLSTALLWFMSAQRRNTDIFHNIIDITMSIQTPSRKVHANMMRGLAPGTGLSIFHECDVTECPRIRPRIGQAGRKQAASFSWCRKCCLGVPP